MKLCIFLGIKQAPGYRLLILRLVHFSTKAIRREVWLTMFLLSYFWDHNLYHLIIHLGFRIRFYTNDTMFRHDIDAINSNM